MFYIITIQSGVQNVIQNYFGSYSSMLKLKPVFKPIIKVELTTWENVEFQNHFLHYIKKVQTQFWQSLKDGTKGRIKLRLNTRTLYHAYKPNTGSLQSIYSNYAPTAILRFTSKICSI